MVLGLPLIGSHLAQFAITMTDTIMLGWYDVTALAALTIAGSLYFVLFLVGTGIAWAVMPMVAAADAKDDARQVRRVTRMGVWLSAGFGVIVLPLSIWSEPILLALGQDPEVSRLGQDYLRIAGFGLIPALVITVLKSYLSALEHSRIVLYITLGSTVLNAALNYALIFGNWGAPEMGVRGAATASVLIQIAGVIAFALYAQLRTPEYKLLQNPHLPDWNAMAQVGRLAWPISLTNLAEVGLFTAASIMMGWVGTIPLAAHGIALQIASVTFMFHLGLSQAVTVRVGHAYGRGDTLAMRQSSMAGLIVAGLFVALTIAAFLLAPGLLIGAFLAPDEPARPQILAIGGVLLAMAALFQLFDAAQVVTLGMLRGIQDTRVPMVMASVAYWCIGLPASYVLGFTFGLEGVGVWAGLSVGLAVAAVLLSHRFWRGTVVNPTERSEASP